MNQDEVNELRAERLTKTHDPLGLMAHSQNSYDFLETHNDQSSSSTHSQQSFPITNKYNPQPSLNQNFMQPPMNYLEYINDPTEAMNATLTLFPKAFQLTTPNNNNQRTSSNPHNRQIAQPVAQNHQAYNAWHTGGIQVAQNAVQNLGVQNGGNQNGLVVVLGIANQNGTGNIITAMAEGTGNGNQVRLICSLLKRKKQGFNFKHKNLTSWLLQLDKAPVYDTDGSAENDNHVTSVAPNMVQTKVSKMISIPNEDLLDDTTPSVSRKFLNEVKNSLVILQRVVKQKITLEVHNWSSSAHKEVHKIISHEIAPMINQVDAQVQNFKIQFLKEAAKFVRDFKSLAKEVYESLDKQKPLELKIERLLKVSVNHDIMSIVQNGFVDAPSDLQTELDCMKEKLEHCIIKKEKEYAVLWNNRYTECEECNYDKISYDKAYNDMQQKIKRLQAQLEDLKGKSSDTPSASNTLDPLNKKLEKKIMELEFQVVNYECEIRHLKTTYKNLFDSITSNQAHAKLHNLIYENAKL
uniref:Uncharacterized protein n=1 Tax=Tanacetum cinerariifolium TaxID=118510 RepID=A0A699HZK4_TANCI|nr:hypothetical protein [Tanacetum cinerariifolium]